MAARQLDNSPTERKRHDFMSAVAAEPHDLAEFFDANLAFPSEDKRRRQAILAARVVEMAGPLEVGQARQTLIACAGDPGKRRCDSFYLVMKLPRDLIRPVCPVCRSCPFILRNWQDSRWAAGIAEPFSPVGLAQANGLESAQERARKAREEEAWRALARELSACRSRLKLEEVKHLMTTSAEPSEMLATFVQSLPTDLQDVQAERVIGCALDVWQATHGDLNL